MSLTGAVRAAATKFDPYPGADLVLDWYGRGGAPLFRAGAIHFPTFDSMIGAGVVSFSRASAALMPVGAGLVPFASGAPRWRPGLGILIEESRRNRSINSGNPTTVAGLANYGDAARVLQLVDDPVNLAAAGLDTVCTSGKVINLDNTAAGAASYVVLSGTVSGLVQQIQSVYARGVGNYAVSLDAGADSGGFGVTALTPAYVRKAGAAGSVPTVSGASLRIQANAGANVFVALNLLEAGGFSLSPIVTTGSAATRGADNLNTPYNIPAGRDFTIRQSVRFTRDTGVAADLINVSDGTVNNMVQVVKTGGANIQGVVYVAGVGTLIGQVVKAGARTLDIEFTRAGDLYSFKVDGVLAGSVAVAGLPALTDIAAGRRVTNANWLNDNIHWLALWPYAHTT